MVRDEVSLPSFYEERNFHGSLSSITTTGSLRVAESWPSQQISFATTVTTILIPVVLGDHPACSEGPPVQLAEGRDLTIIKYEPVHFSRQTTSIGNEEHFLLTAQERSNMLLQAGYSVEQLHNAMDSVTFEQRHRRDSLVAVMTGNARGNHHLPLGKKEHVWIDRIVFQSQNKEEEEDDSLPRMRRSRSSGSFTSSSSSSSSSHGRFLSGVGKAFKKLVAPLSNNSASMPLSVVALSDPMCPEQFESARSA